MRLRITDRKARLLRRLTALHGFEAPADLREIVVDVARAGRLRLNRRRNEVRLRLERPLKNGATWLRATSLGQREREILRVVVAGADRSTLPRPELLRDVALMNNVSIAELEGLSDSDLGILVGLGAFVTEV